MTGFKAQLSSVKTKLKDNLRALRENAAFVLFSRKSRKRESIALLVEREK